MPTLLSTASRLVPITAIDPVTITITLLAAFLTLTPAGRDAVASMYLRITGSHPAQLAHPVSYFGKDDGWPTFDSHTLWANIVKKVRGTPAAVLKGRKALTELSGSGWRQICNFAVDTTSDVWVPEPVLDQWRLRADTQADAAVAALAAYRQKNPSATPTDKLTDVFNLDIDKHNMPVLPAGHPSVAPHVASCQPLIDQVSARPPRGAGAISEKWYKHRDERRKAMGIPLQSPLSPEELAEELREEARVIRAGQRVFFKYLEPMQVTLLHFSLAGGFSSPKIMSVLRETGYLVPSKDPYAQTTTTQSNPASTHNSHAQSAAAAPTPSKYTTSLKDNSSPSDKNAADRTFTRLLETTQFVVDVMQDVDALLPPALFANAWTRAQYAQCGPEEGKRGLSSGEQDQAESAHSMYGIGAEERAWLGQVRGGRGWQSAVRVRLLHASVRARIWNSLGLSLGDHGDGGGGGGGDDDDGPDGADAGSGCPFAPPGFGAASASSRDIADTGTGSYDLAANGQPINQEDMLATLAGFSSAPLWCLTRMGLPLTPQEREDYVALWRHVGYYLGCEPALLRRHFGDARAALGLLFSVVGHVYPESVTGVRPDQAAATKEAEQGTIAALALLQSVAGKPPLRLPMEVHCSLARHFLGPCLATYLRIPPTTPRLQLATDLFLLSVQVPVHFVSDCALYPRALRQRWETRRCQLARWDVRRTVRAGLGGGVTARFDGRLRALPSRSPPASSSSSSSSSSSTTPQGEPGDEKMVVAQERMDRVRAAVMLEMTGFLLGLGAVVVYVGVYVGLLRSVWAR